MIINTEQGNIEIIGDVKEFKTSIDPKNLEFITTLLSSNLYSNPEESFIREIVSNAWDSHVEAGTTDIPVIIKFNKLDSSITIRDFGTGLSVKRFNEIYRNIGSSTKRDSNDYIGCFGIGHLSPFACSNTVNIISYYNGKAYYYIGSKVNNSITYHQLNETNTDEKNGVEITIKNIKDIQRFQQALRAIIFFPNIYIEGGNWIYCKDINEAKLKRFKAFAAASIKINNKLLLGNVLYPIHKFNLSSEALNFINAISNTGIVIRFDIGELDVTPNREGLIYNSRTTKIVENRIKEAKKELEALIRNKIKKNFTNIKEYYDYVTEPIYYDPISDDLLREYGSAGYQLLSPNIPFDVITYKDKNITFNIPLIRDILNIKLPSFRGVIFNNTIYVKRLPYNCNLRNAGTSKYTNTIVFNKGTRLSTVVQGFLKEKYNRYSIITEISYDEFKDYVTKVLRFEYTNEAKYIIQEIYYTIISKFKTINLDTDTEFQEYKADFLKKDKKTYVKERETILYSWERGYKRKRVFNDFSTALKYIKGLRTGIILSDMKGNDDLLSAMARIKDYVYIKARKDIVNDLKSINLKCLVDNTAILNKDLSIVSVINKWFPNGLPLGFKTILESMPTNIIEGFTEAWWLYEKYIKDYYLKPLINTYEGPVDSCIESLCMKIKPCISKYDKAVKIANDIGATYDNILVPTLLLKMKAYRINSKLYKKIKNNEAIRILCKK